MLVRRVLDLYTDETYNSETGETTVRISSHPVTYLDKETGDYAPIDLRFRENETSYYCESNGIGIWVYKDGEVDFSIMSDFGLTADVKMGALKLDGTELLKDAPPDRLDGIISESLDNQGVLLLRNTVNSNFLDEYVLYPDGYKHNLYIEEPLEGIANGSILEIPYTYEFNSPVQFETWSGVKEGLFETATDITIRNLDNPSETLHVKEPVFYDINQEGNLPIWYKVQIVSPQKAIISYVVETNAFYNENVQYPLIIDPVIVKGLYCVMGHGSTDWAPDEYVKFMIPWTQSVKIMYNCRGYSTSYSSNTSSIGFWDGSANNSYTTSNARLYKTSSDKTLHSSSGTYYTANGGENFRGDTVKWSYLRAWKNRGEGAGDNSKADIYCVFSNSRVFPSTGSAWKTNFGTDSAVNNFWVLQREWIEGTDGYYDDDDNWVEPEPGHWRYNDSVYYNNLKTYSKVNGGIPKRGTGTAWSTGKKMYAYTPEGWQCVYFTDTSLERRSVSSKSSYPRSYANSPSTW